MVTSVFSAISSTVSPTISRISRILRATSRSFSVSTFVIFGSSLSFLRGNKKTAPKKVSLRRVNVFTRGTTQIAVELPLRIKQSLCLYAARREAPTQMNLFRLPARKGWATKNTADGLHQPPSLCKAKRSKPSSSQPLLSSI